MYPLLGSTDVLSVIRIFVFRYLTVLNRLKNWQAHTTNNAIKSCAAQWHDPVLFPEANDLLNFVLFPYNKFLLLFKIGLLWFEKIWWLIDGCCFCPECPSYWKLRGFMSGIPIGGFARWSLVVWAVWLMIGQTVFTAYLCKQLRFSYFERAMSSLEFSDPNQKYRVSVEGNIGCGKSTFLKYFEGISPNVEVLSEPIEQWRNAKGYNLFVISILK